MILLSPLLFLVMSVFHYIVAHKSRSIEQSSTDFINIQVNRTIDLTRLIIRIESKILIKSKKVDAIYSYKLPLLKNSTRNLVSLSAKLQSASDENDLLKLKINKQKSSTHEELDFYEINFKSEPMNYEEERYLIITEQYFAKLGLLPKKISLKQDQLVVFSDTINHLSFYTTNNQQIIVELPSERTEIM
jgi:hypothetical protein